MLCKEIGARVSTTRVVGVDDEITPDLPMACAEMLASFEAGDDPTAGWRQLFVDGTVRTSGVCPPGLDDTFILSFYCDVLATPAAHAALAISRPHLIDLTPGLVSFSLSLPWAHPASVQLRPGGVEEASDTTSAERAAYEKYREHADRFAGPFARIRGIPSRQRDGIVGDSWNLAHSRAIGEPPGQVRRTACCLLYALPGAHECAGCPRRA